MARRVHWDFISGNKEMFKLFNEQSESETNGEKLKLVKKALKKVVEEQLSARQKQMIVLYYYKEIDMPEIAEMLGINVSTVSRTLNRARQNLMKYLKYYF